MADETIIDKAMALIPGKSAKKKRPTTPANRQKQLAVIQKQLAALSKHVDKLTAVVAAEAKKAASTKPAAKRPAARRGAAKKPGARKPAARRTTSGGKRSPKN